MPTYQYRCRDCQADLEIFQKFSDPTLTVCPECDGNLRKVFNSVGVVFKGSGFYATDSRTSNKAEKKAPAETSASTDGASSTSKSDTGTSSGSSEKKAS